MEDPAKQRPDKRPRMTSNETTSRKRKRKDHELENLTQKIQDLETFVQHLQLEISTNTVYQKRWPSGDPPSYIM